MLAVSRAPVEMRASHTARGPHEANLLPALHGIPDGDERLGQMEVAGHDAAAMIDVHDIAGEEEIVHQRHHTPVRGADGIPRLAGEIHTPVTARQASVEEPPGPERA